MQQYSLEREGWDEGGCGIGGGSGSRSESRSKTRKKKVKVISGMSKIRD